MDSDRDLLPLGAALLAAGVFPKYYDGPHSILNSITFDALLGRINKEIAAGQAADHEINRLVRLGDRRTPTVLDALLTSGNLRSQKSVAFALAFAPLPESQERLLALLKEPGPTPTNFEMRWCEEVELYHVVSYTLGLLRDPRSIDGLIALLRGLRHFASGALSHATKDLYEAYASDRLAYLPRRADDVQQFPSLTLTAFIVEDLLVQLGSRAHSSLLVALNHGGRQNYNLTFPLRRLGWVPASPIEQCFFDLYDPQKTESEQIEYSEHYRTPPLNHGERRCIVRSLIDTVNPFNSVMAQCIRPSVRSGELLLWEEVGFAEEYDRRTLFSFGAFLRDAHEEHWGPLGRNIRNSLQDAGLRCSARVTQ